MKHIRQMVMRVLAPSLGRSRGLATAPRRNCQVRTRTVLERGSGRVHRYVEMRPGPSAAMQTRPGPAISFPDNINDGVLEITTLDGRRRQSHPLGVSFNDGENTVFIATVKHSRGVSTGPESMVYRDAFEGFAADLLCICRDGGFEYELIFHGQAPMPANYGLGQKFRTLQLVSEYFNPVHTERMADSDDEWLGGLGATLQFDELTAIYGESGVRLRARTASPNFDALVR